MIPPVFEKYFEDKDDKNLQENNANCSDIFLIKIDNGERKEINFNLNGLNSTIKIIMLIGENCDVNIKKILLQDGEDTGSVDFVTLVEKGTKLKIDDIVFSSNYSKIEIFERIFSLQEENDVKINIKSAAKDKSKIFCEAFAFIDEKSEKTNLNVKEEGMIFDNAKIDFLPKLKIENNDVTAGHSAFIKKFTEEEMFYLQSRGLNKEQGEKLLLEGFLEGLDLNNIF